MTPTDQPALPLQFSDDTLLALLCDTRRELAAVTRQVNAIEERVADDGLVGGRAEVLHMLEDHWGIGAP